MKIAPCKTIVRVLAGVLGLCAVLTAAPVQAQAYPNRPVRIVVPFPPGGFSDLYARAIATRMAETFGQPVLVDNRPGAGGNVAADQVAKSAPDGYTLVMGTIGTHAINATLFPKLPYDPIKDFAPVALVVDADGLLVAHPSIEARNVQELISLAKKKPGAMNYASAGPGTTGHLAAEIFKQRTSTFITHIPYKGNVPALQDVMGGYAQVSFATLATVLPHVKGGRLKPLAVLGSHRSAALPAVPTVAESGVPGFEVGNWTGLFAPAGTPAPVVEKLNAEVQRIMKLPDIQKRMGDEGMRFTPMSPSQFGDFCRSEIARWGAVIRRAGVTAE
jgi:tripartite-type tricarboxylate transporter receptor subunit TctC